MILFLIYYFNNMIENNDYLLHSFQNKNKININYFLLSINMVNLLDFFTPSNVIIALAAIIILSIICNIN